jgi:hypothetical protein
MCVDPFALKSGLDIVGEAGNMAALIALFRSPTFWVCLLAGVLICLGVSELLAQAPAPSVPPSLPPSVPPAGGGSGIIETGRSLTFEWIITAAMCGLALFVVCRSSNRN